MSPEMYCCCKMQSSWIFVYENKQVWGICENHFASDAHRLFVKNVINIQTNTLYSPDEIFSKILAEAI